MSPHAASRALETGASSTLARIRAYAALLGPSESAVAKAVLDHSVEVPQWSTQQLAAAAGTSAATVIRACQRLGFTGFQHLRLELAREGAPADAAPGDGVSRVFESAREALLLGRDAVDREALAGAATVVAGARRVFFTANGFSAPPLQDAAMRFATIGRAVEAPIDILAQQFAAHTLGPEDVCVALSHSGANTHTLATCRAAKQRGAAVIALCSYTRAPIPELADVVVSTGAVGPQHSVDPFFVRLSHSVLLHALLMAVADGLDAAETTDSQAMRSVVARALADTGE
ncbi:MurR/RpiR family transcriptional regulator [Leucobacter sp. wl10]|uniref:MurR/RpiR family transcriptional regulator n=1 Tax=Leucobacter sp. wl10 TaxID=2304677 RepID=UPI000E5A56A5|nr:MurR/RpiR family transcriptional regulator [Leucobacter sp. wl10]RGE20301.1 MurR/RpiR family transcriptional regulator [Leucobacter sp. wl10]